jgi:hypothetical protein
MEAYKLIFPDLKWDEITFYKGLPFPVQHGSGNAITIPKLGATEIYIREPRYVPCTPSTFTLIAHELVHAVQVQSAATRWLARLSYLTCFFADGIWHKYDNCYEREARALQEWLGGRSGYPCDCAGGGSPTRVFSSAIGPLIDTSYIAQLRLDLATTESQWVKRDTDCSLGDCFGSNIFGIAKGLLSFVVALIINVVGTFYFEGPFSQWTTVTGVVGGGLYGAALATGFGAVAGGGGFLLTVFLGAVGGGIIGGLVLGLVGAIIDWVLGLFLDGKSGGSVNVMFSTDSGLSFDNKVTAGVRSCEQPSLAFRANPDKLLLGWTGTEDQLHVFIAPDKIHGATDSSGPCGPALTTGGGQVFMAWKGTDDHPRCQVSNDGINWGGMFTSGGDGPRESTPAVAFGNGMIYVSWVGPDNYIRLIQLRSDNPMKEVPLPPELHKLPAKTGHKGTPALAFADRSGKGDLFLAWSSFQSPHRLNLLTLKVKTDGTIDPSQLLNSRLLWDWTSDATGPALAFSRRENRLYLSFTGADDTVWVISSTDDGKTFPTRNQLGGGFEKSRHDAGPAIAVHPTGTVAVAWVGVDGN